jgi:hypothetical protein
MICKVKVTLKDLRKAALPQKIVMGKNEGVEVYDQFLPANLGLLQYVLCNGNLFCFILESLFFRKVTVLHYIV